MQRHLSGRLKATSGSVNLLGRPIEEVSPANRAQTMAVMSQSEHIEPLLSVEEYISLGRIPYKQQLAVSENLSEIERAISVCGLNNFKYQTIQTLSGGERQRASLARAIAQSPNLLFLDEPTAGVDVELRHDLWLYLQELHKDGKTILLTTHYIDEAELLCERVGIIDKGKLIVEDLSLIHISEPTRPY